MGIELAAALGLSGPVARASALLIEGRLMGISEANQIRPTVFYIRLLYNFFFVGMRCLFVVIFCMPYGCDVKFLSLYFYVIYCICP